jgi:hypothetical protein
MDLGEVGAGPHTLKLYTAGTQFGVANLDKLTISSVYDAPPPPIQPYEREAEYPNVYTVGTADTRTNASAGLAHVQFGCEGYNPWPARAGYVEYNLPGLVTQEQHLYLRVRYSKNHFAGVPIRVYLDGQEQAVFTPINQYSWNTFGEIAAIRLGSVSPGPHTLRLYTDGTQWGTADLDKITITSSEPPDSGPTTTPTPTETLTPTPSATPSDTPSPTPSDTPSPTPTETVTPTPSDTPSPTPTGETITPTPTLTPTDTPSPTPSDTPSPTPTDTPSPTPDTPSPTPSDTPSPTPSHTPSPTPTDTPPPSQDIKLEQGTLTNVGSSWQQVTLPQSYTSMVVVAAVNYDNTDAPAVVRVRNAAGNSFDIKVQNPSDQALSGYTVHYVVVEEGVYTVASHGVKMEAVKVSSTVTDRAGSWVGQSRGYQQSYASPVVLGQVVTANDADWSVFWARGTNRSTPPTASTLYAGKNVAEDTDTYRANETVGYIVVEAGSGSIEGTGYTAGLGADIVAGVTNAPPYNYSLSGLSSAEVAIVSAAAMDGGNGGWPLLYGNSPVSTSQLQLAFDEDQVKDSERSHTAEQVAYLVLEGDGPIQPYDREAEYPDAYTVGSVATRTNASQQLVHARLGCEEYNPWPAKAGYAQYNIPDLLTKATNLYLSVRYSKGGTAAVPVYVYLDGEATPRASFTPVNTGSWNAFTETGSINLGVVSPGTHTLKFHTYGTQWGVADLDIFTVTSTP